MARSVFRAMKMYDVAKFSWEKYANTNIAPVARTLNSKVAPKYSRNHYKRKRNLAYGV